MKSRIRILIGVISTVFFCYLFLANADFQSIQLVISQLSVFELGSALLFLMVGHAVRILRWAWLLRPICPAVSPGLCLVPYGSAIAVNNLLPLRAGDVYRVVGFSRQLGASSGQVLGTVLVERILDSLILAFFVAAGIPAALNGPVGQGFSEPSYLSLAAIGLVGFLALSFAPRLARLYRQASPEIGHQSSKLHGIIYSFNSQLANAVESFSGPSVWLPATALSIFAWFCSGAVFTIAAGNQLQPVPLWAAWFSMAMGNLGTLLPGTPGAFGTFHYFAALGLVSYGVDWSLAVAAVVVVHLVQWLSTTAFGLACLGWNAINTHGADARRHDEP